MHVDDFYRNSLSWHRSKSVFEFSSSVSCLNNGKSLGLGSGCITFSPHFISNMLETKRSVCFPLFSVSNLVLDSDVFSNHFCIIFERDILSSSEEFFPKNRSRNRFPNSVKVGLSIGTQTPVVTIPIKKP